MRIFGMTSPVYSGSNDGGAGVVTDTTVVDGAGDLVGDAGKGVTDTTKPVVDEGDLVSDAGKVLTPEEKAAADAAKLADADKAKVLTPEEQAAKDAADEAAKVPDKYEFKVKDGLTLDETAIEAVTPLLKELGLNQEQAQKLADFHQEQQAKVVPALMEKYAAQQQVWRSEAKADKEFGEMAGGKSFAENMSLVAAGRDAFGDADFAKALKDSGMGNHPSVVRFLFKVGKAVSSGTVFTGSTGGRGAPGTGGEDAIGSRIFTNTKFGA